MNPDDLIGLTSQQAQALWRQSSLMELRFIESAPPQRPAPRSNPNRSPRKLKPVAQPKPIRVQHWGEARVLRCREANENGTPFLEVTIAREEAASESVSQVSRNAEHPS
jgi:hypothetical protein